MRTGRSSRSVDYLLSALSPQDVANSAAAYVDARDPDSMLLEIKRSVARMRGGERAQYALALGYELPTRDDFPISEPVIDAQTILQWIDMDRTHAIARFGPLLEHNPRILRTLDPQSIREIFLPVINARQAEVQGTDIGDDVPYTAELAAALQRSIPAITLRRAARSAADVPRRITAAFVERVAAVGRGALTIARWIATPFIIAARALLAAARYVATLPRRIAAALLAAVSALGRGAIALGRLIATPFIAAGHALAAFARYLATIPPRARTALLAALSALHKASIAAAHLIAIPFIAAGRGLTAFARYLATIPPRARAALLAALSALSKASIAFARLLAKPLIATGLALAAFGRYLATIPPRLHAPMLGMLTAIGHSGSQAARSISTVFVPRTVARSRSVLAAGRRNATILSQRAGRYGSAAATTGRQILQIAVPPLRAAAIPLALALCAALTGAFIVKALAPVVRQMDATQQPAPVVAMAHHKAAVKPHHHRRRVAAVPVKAQPRRIARAAGHSLRKPAPARIAYSRKRIVIAHRRPRIQSGWKFDPGINPFIAETQIARLRSAPVHRGGILPAHVATSIPPREPQLVQRARLIVTSYLASLMRGDASTALGHLGLSSSAPVSNLSEGPVVQRSAGFHIIRASLVAPHSAKVDVEISVPRGQYFAVYTVETNGPAAWITRHTIIPTAKDVAQHG